MNDLTKYDRMYLSLIDLQKRVEKLMGNDSEVFELLDETRIAMINNAPAGWRVEDVVEGVGDE